MSVRIRQENAIVIEAALVAVDCCACGVVFAITHDFEARRRADHTSFYCPNGHRQGYTAKTKADELADELAEAQRKLAAEKNRVARLRAESDQLAAEAQDLRRSRSALRGVVTRERNRVHAGVCPLCSTTFPELAAHMAETHALADWHQDGDGA